MLANSRRSRRAPAAHRPAPLPRHAPAREPVRERRPARPLISLALRWKEAGAAAPDSLQGSADTHPARGGFLAGAGGCGVAAEKSPFPANLVRQVTHRQPQRRQPGPASVWMQFSKHLSKLNEYRLRRVRGSPRPIRSHFAKYKASQSGISLPSSHSLPSQIVAMGTATERQLINTIISPQFLPFSPIVFTPTKAFLFKNDQI